MPVAKSRSFKREEVSRGEAIAIKIASRMNLMSALESALDSLLRSVMYQMKMRARVAPAIRKRKPGQEKLINLIIVVIVKFVIQN